MFTHTLSRHPFRTSLLLLAVAANAAHGAKKPSAIDELRGELASLRTELATEREQNKRLADSVQVLSVKLSTLATPTIVPNPVDRTEVTQILEREKANAPFRVPQGMSVDFGGQYRVMTDNGNFGFHQATIPAPGAATSPQVHSLQNLRLRNNLTVNADERYGAFFQFEIGHLDLATSTAGSADFPRAAGNPSNPFTQSGDVEIRRAYIFDNRGDKGIYRFGILDYTDPYGGFLASADWDFSVGGLDMSKRLGDCEHGPILRLGLYQLVEGLLNKADDTTLFSGDLTWTCKPGTAIGGAVQYMDDSGQYSYQHRTAAGLPYVSSHDTWVGVHGTTRLGDVTLNGAAVGNHGSRLDLVGGTFEHDGGLVRVEALAPVGKHDHLAVQAMHSSGQSDPTARNSNEFRTIAQSVGDNFGAESYWGYLSITSPHGPSDLFDLGVSAQNRSLGLNTLQARYDFPIKGAFSATLAAGILASDVTNPANGGKNIGTEARAEVQWQMGRHMVLQTGAAHLWTGDFYKTSPTAGEPDNVYQLYSRTQMEF